MHHDEAGASSVVLFGAGSPVIVDVEESCARRGWRIAAVVKNVPGNDTPQTHCDAGAFGDLTFINRGASLGHHLDLGEYASIGPGVVVVGQVTIGAGAMIGAGAIASRHIDWPRRHCCRWRSRASRRARGREGHRPARGMTGIWLYTMSWNEERMLPFFFRHYDRWIDRYIVYDDASTDHTLAMLAAHPMVEVRRFTRLMPQSFVWSATGLQNTVWKEARNQADWVVITPVDEHLYHRDILAYLADCRRAGVSAIPALGFQMVTDRFPDSMEWLAEERRMGAPFPLMNKLSIFDPNQIEATNFALGRHSAEPTGTVVYPEADELVNLHYKYLGLDYVRSRHSLLLSGLGDVDKAGGLGSEYRLATERLAAELRRLAAQAIDYRDPTVGFTTHVQRWWRGRRLTATS